jgi:hypothetical protein
MGLATASTYPFGEHRGSCEARAFGLFFRDQRFASWPTCLLSEPAAMALGNRS